jgi:hypothetical protein
LGGPTLNPVEIYQDVLDQLSHAALHGEVDILHRYIRLPFSYTTHGGSFTLATAQEMTAYCLSFTETLRLLGATDYMRIARDAVYLDPLRIEGTHYSHIICDGQRIHPPYASRMVIEKAPGNWQVTKAVHAIANDTFPIALPEAASGCEVVPSPIAIVVH